MVKCIYEVLLKDDEIHIFIFKMMVRVAVKNYISQSLAQEFFLTTFSYILNNTC